MAARKDGWAFRGGGLTGVQGVDSYLRARKGEHEFSYKGRRQPSLTLEPPHHLIFWLIFMM